MRSAGDLRFGRGLRFRTASGEKIASGPDAILRGMDCNGRRIALKGARAPVSNVLCSAGEVTGNGNIAILMKSGGCIVPEGTFQSEILEVVRRHTKMQSRYTKLYKENGIFKLYVKLDSSPRVPHEDLTKLDGDVRLCPVVDGSSGIDADFPRQPTA